MKVNEPLSFVEISKKNLIHNIKALKSFAKRGVKFAVAVKGNAYGHDLDTVVKILNPYVDYFQINSIEELLSLRKVSNKKVILLGYVGMSSLKHVLNKNCILSVFSLEELKALVKIANSRKIKQEIYLPIDAHLGREGFMEEDIAEVLEEIKKQKYIKLVGVYAHFANIEDTNNFTHAKRQIKKYQRILNTLRKYGFKNLQTHISATSGLLMYEKNTGANDLIRLGIGVYGMWPSRHIKFMRKNKITLKPVLSWKTKVSHIKTLPPGHTIGYGLTYMTYAPTKIAVIPQGYADGFDRRFSNKGFVLIRGKRCKILGRVSMNMFTVDVTHLDDVVIEDEVVILGRQGSDKIDAEEMADFIDTINYEITTMISPLLPRVVI